MRPGPQALAMQDVLELVEQLLRAPDAEGGHDHRAAVLERMLDDRLQTRTPVAAILVDAVAVGGLQHQHVRPPGRTRRRQQRRVRRPEIAREHHPERLRPRPARELALDVGRAEDVAGALQADPAARVRAAIHQVPLAVGQRADARLHLAEVALDQGAVAAHTHREGVGEHGGQQACRGLAAQDRPLEASGEQPRQAAAMVDVDVGQHQRANTLEREIDLQPVGGRAPVGRGLRALEQAAVDQQAVAPLDEKLVTGTGDAVARAVVQDGRVHDVILDAHAPTSTRGGPAAPASAACAR